jgi:rhodanese-related sulfurtransferase
MATPISTEDCYLSVKTFQVVDVRRRPNFDASSQMISGAAWANPEEVETWGANLDLHRPVVVYCAHGHQVSQAYAESLQKARYDACYLEGGFKAWAAERMPLMTKV